MTRYDIVCDNYEFGYLHNVCKDGKWGIFNSKTNKEVINTIYDDISILDGNFFAVKVGEYWGVIKNTGELITSTTCAEVFDFDEEFILLDIDGYYEILSKKTNQSSKQYNLIQHFIEDYALVEYEDSWGIINKDFIEVVPTRYDNILRINNHTFFAKYDSVVLLLDLEKKTAELSEYSSVFVAYNNYIVKKDNLMGVINRNCNVIIPLQFSHINSINEDLFAVTLTDINNKKRCGIIDTDAKVIIECKYNNIRKSNRGHFFVENDSNFWALFDPTGKQLTEFKYASLVQLSSYILASVSKENCNNSEDDDEENYLVGLLDFSGKEVIEPIYDRICSKDRSFIVTLNNKKGIYDSNLKLVSKIIYDDVYRISEYNLIGKKHADVSLNDSYGKFYW